MPASRPALALAPLLLLLHSLACSSHAPPAPPPGDVIYQGSADSDALAAMLAATSTDDPAHAAFFDNPKDLTEIPGTPIITFTWHDGQQASGQPALTGTGYLLTFGSDDTGEELFHVFTSSTSYTPDAASWAKIATGTWTTLQIESAVFDADQVAAGGGPWNGQEIKFCIGTWQ
jgi:hypothetical protein